MCKLPAYVSVFRSTTIVYLDDERIGNMERLVTDDEK